MKSKLGLLALIAAAWWITVNVLWVEVGASSLTGSDLAPVLNLAPAIVLMTIFIVSYKRLVVPLLSLVALVAASSAFFTLSTPWAKSQAVVNVLEQLSGVMNADQHAAGVAVTLNPLLYVSAAMAVLVAVLAIWIAVKPSLKTASVGEEESDVSDNRALWDEQG